MRDLHSVLHYSANDQQLQAKTRRCPPVMKPSSSSDPELSTPPSEPDSLAAFRRVPSLITKSGSSSDPSRVSGRSVGLRGDELSEPAMLSLFGSYFLPENE
jgi:hypothetical protein